MSVPGFLAWSMAGFAVAAALAAATTGLAAFLGRKGEAPSGPRWGPSVGLGLAYPLGHAMVREWFSGTRPADAWREFQSWTRDGGVFPLFPGDAFDWVPWLAAAAMIFGMLDAIRPAPLWARWENRILLTALTLWLILGPMVNGTWEPGQGARWLIGLGGAMLASWAILDLRAESLGPSMPTVLGLLAGSLAAVSLLSGTFVIGLLGGVLASSLAGIWLCSWFAPRMNLARGAIPPFVVVFAGLLLSGHFYAEIPKVSAAALALAPVVTFIDRIVPIRCLGPTKLGAVRLGAMLIPLAVAIGYAIAMRPGEGPEVP